MASTNEVASSSPASETKVPSGFSRLYAVSLRREFIGGKSGELKVVESGRRDVLALGVVEGHFGNERGAPDEKTAYRTKEYSNDKERWENCLWSKYRLPCLESLLLEGGICGKRRE